jgi:hypothetical protein
LKNCTFWDASKDYYIYEIGNDGKATVGSKNIPGKEKPIDLKKFIGD